MGDTKIQWTGKTWNPIRARNKATGNIGWFCEHVSEGCRNCYAEKMNRNTYFGTGLDYKPVVLDQVELFLDEKILHQPLHWRKPTMVFPCSMTDLFGRWVKDEWLDRMFGVMALAKQHIFQCLTKRPDRMRDYIKDRFVNNQTHLSDAACWASETANTLAYAATKKIDQDSNDSVYERLWGSLHHNGYFPNVWLGVSVEDQKTADERIPLLLQTPAAVRWISAEPLLGPIDLRNLRDGTYNALDGIDYEDIGDIRDAGILGKSDLPGLDWVVVGGESGPKARILDLAWARSIVEQSRSAGVPVFVKQIGPHPVSNQKEERPWAPLFHDAYGRKPTGEYGIVLKNRKGGDINEWPIDLRVREFPSVVTPKAV